MKMQVSTCLIAAVLLCGVSQAGATTFNWSFSGNGGVSGSGTLDAGLLSGTEYLVTSITGSVDGSSIGVIEPVNTFQLNDNLIFSPGPEHLSHGLEFTCPSCGGVDSLFAFGSPNSRDFFETGLAGFSQTSTQIQFALSPVSATATPLPPALPLFAFGLGVMGLLGWRRKLKSTLADA